jgi:hypothetical protein
MKVTIRGWIVRWQSSWADKPSWSFYEGATRPTDSEDRIVVCEHSFEIEVPDGDMIAERVAGIREAKRQTYVNCEERVAELIVAEENLLALEAPCV